MCLVCFTCCLVAYSLNFFFISDAWAFWLCFIKNCQNFVFLAFNLHFEEIYLTFLVCWILCFWVKRTYGTIILFRGSIGFIFTFISISIIILLGCQPVKYVFFLSNYFSVFNQDSFFYAINFVPVTYVWVNSYIAFGDTLLMLTSTTFMFKAVLLGLSAILLLYTVLEGFMLSLYKNFNWNLVVVQLCLFFFSFFIVAANDLFLFFMNLIGLNIIVYTLLLTENSLSNAIEGPIKYFFLSTISSLFFIGGVALVYTFWKTTSLVDLHLITKHLTNQASIEFIKNFVSNNNSTLAALAFYYSSTYDMYLTYVYLFLFLGFIFKLSLYPLHSWAAEVYSIISFRLLLVFVVLLKGTFFFKFVHIFLYALNFNRFCSSYALNVFFCFVVLGSIAISSLSVLFEDKIRKIVAFSSTNQIGFAFIGILVAPTSLVDFSFISKVGWPLTFLFIIIYLLGMLVTLLIFSYLDIFFLRLKHVTDLSRLSFYWLCGVFILFFSFSGIPPFVGFFTKFYIISYLWSVNLSWLAVTIIFFSVISCYYYLRVIKIVGFDRPALWLLHHKFFFLKRYTSFNGLLSWPVTALLKFIIIVLSFFCSAQLILFSIFPLFIPYVFSIIHVLFFNWTFLL